MVQLTQPCRGLRGCNCLNRGEREVARARQALCRNLELVHLQAGTSLIPSISSSSSVSTQKSETLELLVCCCFISVWQQLSLDLHISSFGNVERRCSFSSLTVNSSFDVSQLSNTQCSSRPRSTVAGVDPIVVPRRWASRSGAAEHAAAGVEASEGPLGMHNQTPQPCQSITCAPARASVIRPLPVRPKIHPGKPGCLPMRPTAYHGVSPGPGTWRIPAFCSQMLSFL